MDVGTHNFKEHFDADILEYVREDVRLSTLQRKLVRENNTLVSHALACQVFIFSQIYSTDASQDSESRPTEKAYRRKLNFRDKRIVLEAYTNYSLILRVGKYENAVSYSFKIFAFFQMSIVFFHFFTHFDYFRLTQFFRKRHLLKKKIPISPMKKRHTHV